MLPLFDWLRVNPEVLEGLSFESGFNSKFGHGGDLGRMGYFEGVLPRLRPFFALRLRYSPIRKTVRATPALIRGPTISLIVVLG